MINDKSHKTAIHRPDLSKPMQILMDKNLLLGRVLDFGCGFGEDADRCNFEKFDPHFFPELPGGKFQTITCHYVLNVVDNKDVEDSIILELLSLLSKGGSAYISVRRDVKKEGFTSKGTFQRKVCLALPVVFENSWCCIYRLEKL